MAIKASTVFVKAAMYLIVFYGATILLSAILN